MTLGLRLSAVLVLVVTRIAATASVQSEYTAIDLGSLGGDSTTARGINDRGQVVGESLPPSGPIHAFLWQKGQMFDLGVLPGDVSSAALDINNRGQIVGAGAREFEEPHALLWDRGEIVNLGPLPGGGFSIANAINNRGQIAGLSSSAMGFRAVLWDGGVAIDLGALPGEVSEAHDINESGVIAGASWDPVTNLRQAVIWRAGSIVPLGMLPGHDFSEAFGVNNRGQVVGVSGNVAQGIERPVLWEDGVIRDLGAPDGDAFSRARAINERSLVTGVGIWGTTFASGAALFDAGTAVRLPRLPNQEPSSTAEAINNRGQIVGSTSVEGLGARGVIWVPTRQQP